MTARNVGRGSLLHVVINVFSATDCRKRKTMRVRFADQLPATRRYRRNGGTKQRRSQRGSEYIHICTQDRPGHYCPIPVQSGAGSKCSLALRGNYEMTERPSQAAVPTNCTAFSCAARQNLSNSILHLHLNNSNNVSPGRIAAGRHPSTRLLAG